MTGKSNQPSATPFFQPISHDEDTNQLRGTVPIGLSPPPALLQDEKREKDRLRNKLKMKASRDRKKAKEIEERKRDSEGHIIKQNQNAFDRLSPVGKASNTHLSDIAFTTNYSQKRTRKRKIPADYTNPSESSVSLPIKRRYKNWFHPHIWPAIDMAGKRTNYLSREILKHLQSQYRDINL